jgi:hypothetical protein
VIDNGKSPKVDCHVFKQLDREAPISQRELKTETRQLNISFFHKIVEFDLHWLTNQPTP